MTGFARLGVHLNRLALSARIRTSARSDSDASSPLNMCLDVMHASDNRGFLRFLRHLNRPSPFLSDIRLLCLPTWVCFE